MACALFIIVARGLRGNICLRTVSASFFNTFSRRKEIPANERTNCDQRYSEAENCRYCTTCIWLMRIVAPNIRCVRIHSWIIIRHFYFLAMIYTAWMMPGRYPKSVRITLIQKCFVKPTSIATPIGGNRIENIILIMSPLSFVVAVIVFSLIEVFDC